MHRIAQHCSSCALFYTALKCNVMHNTILYCTVLYCHININITNSQLSKSNNFVPLDYKCFVICFSFLPYKTSLLRRLQAQTLPDANPPLAKSTPSVKWPYLLNYWSNRSYSTTMACSNNYVIFTQQFCDFLFLISSYQST